MILIEIGYPCFCCFATSENFDRPMQRPSACIDAMLAQTLVFSSCRKS